MTQDIKVTSVSHGDLVNFLSTATYGDDTFSITCPPEFKDLYEGQYWEDKLANVLLNGGTLKVTDNEEGETYDMTYETILKGFSTANGYGYAKTLLIDEEGDFWTAWNLLQIVLFGKVIYG